MSFIHVYVGITYLIYLNTHLYKYIYKCTFIMCAYVCVCIHIKHEDCFLICPAETS